MACQSCSGTRVSVVVVVMAADHAQEQSSSNNRPKVGNTLLVQED